MGQAARRVRRPEPPPPHLHSVIVSWHRVRLTMAAVESYLATVTMPHTLVVVDNGSEPAEVRRLQRLTDKHGVQLLALGNNRYPGYATNRGWELLPPEATHLHRGDNDFTYLDGWCDHMLAAFASGGYRTFGQVGLRTDSEERNVRTNVGGNCVITRRVWERGVRYDERPWPEFRPGWTEDSYFSPAIRKAGFRWTRVRKPCIVNHGVPDPNDPYYVGTHTERRISL